MPGFIKAYVRFMDRISFWTGLFAMYLVFALLGILLLASFMKVFFLPLNWTVEMAQFVMASYYLLGGAWTLREGEHVRMDLVYGGWPVRRQAKVDLFTNLAMIAFLVLLLYGGVSSTVYAIEYGERSFSPWRPYMWPVKVVLTFGILLTLLQAIAIFFKDWAAARGETLP
ncbi:TRAP transporter small permease subunit [Zavarzinia compransoris]|uniref:TRAP transporter small permease protein n=1 Tax=Zavarzinia compransoris TaxID=1264899 RepID=A0A317EC91_9PROT|nr:TRAP transporter small permease subunit [Zavarzinia compransoris]PWR23896.1 C4-dicarboxylate ABC transporter permease [Zavarzinia compransoris]TDP48140.1 TRAP-type mannitol/chloroaromatic compound transport system permease small subunit [Zavarzinia compransoris]